MEDGGTGWGMGNAGKAGRGMVGPGGGLVARKSTEQGEAREAS